MANKVCIVYSETPATGYKIEMDIMGCNKIFFYFNITTETRPHLLKSWGSCAPFTPVVPIPLCY